VMPEGAQDVPVNSVIAVLAGEGEDVKAAAASAIAAPTKAPEKKTEAVTPSPQPSPTSGRSRPSSTGYGGEGAGTAKPQAQRPSPLPSGERSPPKAAGEGVPVFHGNRIFSSPLARRLAKEVGLDLARVQGSGPHGRVIARDIEVAKSGKGLRAPRAAPAGSAPATAPLLSDQQIRALYEDGSYDFVPHDQIRRVIAQRLTASVQTIPHFYETVDCDIGKLMAAREEINAAAPKTQDGKPTYKLSVNDFVIKALALALQRVPDANVSWTEAGMLKHKHSDISVAVALPGGLITPIVRNAEGKSLSAISNEMRDLAARARAHKLRPHEYQGGTTSVSNLGMYGIKDFTAVINPPQSTILAVGTGEERAVVRNGQLSVATVMSVTLSCDHRAVDGALGAELISAFKMLIENPVMMLV
jgi:pyruvate dehydrogenase E2 component (dihydrolipoamide acetyltransferase)